MTAGDNPAWLPDDAWLAVALTLRLATVASAILLIIAVPVAWWLARSRSWLVTPLEAMVGLPVVLPPTVIGFYLLTLFAPHAWPGRLWLQITGETLAFSFLGLVVGSVCYSLPYAVQPITAAFRSVPPEHLDAAASLGAGSLMTLWRVALPFSRRGLFVAAMLSFAHTVGEFGVVLMLGGSIPGQTRVASIALYDEVQKLNYPSAHRLALLLLGMSFAILVALSVAQRRQRG